MPKTSNRNRNTKSSNTWLKFFAIALGLILIFAAVGLYTTNYVVGTVKNSGLNIDTISSMEVIVEYDDGTRRTITNSPASQAAIVDTKSGKTITNIYTNLYMRPEYTGVVQEYTVSSAPFQVMILDSKGGAVWNRDKSLDPIMPLPTLRSGQDVLISSSTTKTTEEPFNLNIFTNGQTYTLRMFINNFHVKGTFIDGIPFDVMQSTARLEWTFRYTDSGAGASGTGAAASHFDTITLTFALSTS